MPFRLLIALLILVAAPLALLGWVSSTSMRQQSELARDQLSSVLRARLVELDRTLSGVLDQHVRRVSEQLDGPSNVAATLRKLELTDPVVRQGIYVDSAGTLVHPPRPNQGSSDELAIYASLPAMIDGRPQEQGNDSDDPFQMSNVAENLSIQQAEPMIQQRVVPSPNRGARTPSREINQAENRTRSMQAALAQVNQNASPQDLSPQNAPARSGSARSTPARSTSARSTPAQVVGTPRWQVWYLDEGSQLVLWFPLLNGSDVGVMFERARWISDLTAALPDTVSSVVVPDSSSLPGDRSSQHLRTPGFTALVDESKQVIYRWGDEGQRCENPLAVVSLSSPLSSWQLEYHADETLLPKADPTSLYASLAGLAAALIGLGGYVLTSVQRQMKTARSRVTFAGQVSHELRTPLTNIQLYAELAESDLAALPETETRSQLAKRLDVIDAESQRLGRLVSGVLEMIRDDRKQRGPRIVSAIPDEWIDRTLSQFEPSFEKAEIQLVRVANAPLEVGFDPDILEMVLINLLSNVLKYAAEGKRVDVVSELTAKELVVRVADRGPGIARRHHRRIFRPFSRLDDSISAPSGTGIGLAIARRAAARHGGDLRLIPSPSGSCFQLRIPVKR